jgi:exodeoxyribonuclease V beta subunit
LEFEHVILVDKLKGNAPERSLLLYEYDKELFIENIYYKMSKRENFDESYAFVQNKQKKLSEKDRMNVLYVALTRAIESMIVIRKPKGSIFDALGIEPISIGELVNSEQGTVNSEQKTVNSEQGTVNSEQGTVKSEQQSVNLSYYGDRKIAQKEEEGDLDAILFGTALHNSLEIMHSFTLQDLEKALMVIKSSYGLELSNKRLDEIKKRILLLIENKEFQKLLKNAKVTKEQSLSFGGELKQIDLLLEYKNSCMVIDYKSSKKYQQKHILQVIGYKRAIYNITKKFTKGMIIYLLEDGVELVKV